MSSQEPKKNVPIYFYYLAISKQKDSNGTYGIDLWKGVIKECKYQNETGRYFEKRYLTGRRAIWNDWRRNT